MADTHPADYRFAPRREPVATRETKPNKKGGALGLAFLILAVPTVGAGTYAYGRFQQAQGERVSASDDSQITPGGMQEAIELVNSRGRSADVSPRDPVAFQAAGNTYYQRGDIAYFLRGEVETEDAEGFTPSDYRCAETRINLEMCRENRRFRWEHNRGLGLPQNADGIRPARQ